MASSSYEWYVRLRASASVIGRKTQAANPSENPIGALADARKEGRLTIVTGAGLSLPSGVPVWQDLVSSAMKATLTPTMGAGAERLPELLKDRLTTGVRFIEYVLQSKPAFRSHLLRALYEKVDFLHQNKTLDAVVEAVVGADGGEPIRDVLTFNFDNLLEISLENAIQRHSLPFSVVSMFDGGQRRFHRSKNEIRVYHLHGFLPWSRPGDPLPDDNFWRPIVLSESDYYARYWRKDHWANKIQLRKFSETSCLFVGTSFRDDNLRRTLDQISRARRPKEPKCTHGALLRLPREETGEKLFTQLDTESLGVSPIWAVDYDEIPQLIGRII